MPDILKENTKYFNSVMQSIMVLHKTETEVENEKVLFAKFANFLTKNTDEISKFHAVENETVDFLQNFSFTGKIDFTPVRDKLLPLSQIRQKLVEMGNEAKKLAGLPDRYSCFKAVEVCKQLAVFCVNEMKSADYNKVTVALDKNIPKLISIQKKFETENQTISNLVDEVTKLSTQIKNYADRYNKNAVFSHSQQLLSSVEQMKFNSFDNTKVAFQKNIDDIKNLSNAFAKERKDTTALRDKLKKESPDLWREDNEQLVSELDTIIKRGTETSNFVLQSFYNREQSARNKKKQDITGKKQEYAWLRRNCYAAEVNRLSKKYMRLSDFQSGIESIRKGRGLFTKLFETIFYR
jgi:hypothetical protein